MPLSGRNLLEVMIKEFFYNQIKPVIPVQYGWLETKLPEECIEKLWFYIDKYKNTSSFPNTILASVSSNYNLNDDDDWFFNNILLTLCFKYCEFFTNLGENYGVTHNHSYCLKDFWVNFQKETEFTPLHVHSGCIYSFVIWLKIPYDYRQQHFILASNGNTSQSSASDFQFSFKNILGLNEIYNYSLDKTYEGTILFFPSQLAHQVYPFYNCDDYRISISGNIALDTSKFI